MIKELVFENKVNFIITLCVLSHSSAAVESKFSEMNLIKTKFRNKLNVVTINGLKYKFVEGVLCPNKLNQEAFIECLIS